MLNSVTYDLRKASGRQFMACNKKCTVTIFDCLTPPFTLQVVCTAILGGGNASNDTPYLPRFSVGLTLQAVQFAVIGIG